MVTDGMMEGLTTDWRTQQLIQSSPEHAQRAKMAAMAASGKKPAKRRNAGKQQLETGDKIVRNGSTSVIRDAAPPGRKTDKKR